MEQKRMGAERIPVGNSREDIQGELKEAEEPSRVCQCIYRRKRSSETSMRAPQRSIFSFRRTMTTNFMTGLSCTTGSVNEPTKVGAPSKGPYFVSAFRKRCATIRCDGRSLLTSRKKAVQLHNRRRSGLWHVPDLQNGLQMSKVFDNNSQTAAISAAKGHRRLGPARPN